MWVQHKEGAGQIEALWHELLPLKDTWRAMSCTRSFNKHLYRLGTDDGGFRAKREVQLCKSLGHNITSFCALAWPPPPVFEPCSRASKKLISTSFQPSRLFDGHPVQRRKFRTSCHAQVLEKCQCQAKKICMISALSRMREGRSEQAVEAKQGDGVSSRRPITELLTRVCNTSVTGFCPSASTTPADGSAHEQRSGVLNWDAPLGPFSC
jgi:hypothetical protein